MIGVVAETTRLTLTLAAVLALGLVGVATILALTTAWRRSLRRDQDLRSRRSTSGPPPTSRAGGAGSGAAGASDPWAASARRVRVDARLESDLDGSTEWDEVDPPPGWDGGHHPDEGSDREGGRGGRRRPGPP